MAEQTGGTPAVNSVLHSVRILEWLAAQPEAQSLTEISRALTLHKTTVYRTLRTLEGVQWVTQSPESGKYTLGSRTLLLAGAAASRCTPHGLIAEEMHRLAEQFHELVVLAAVRGGTGLCIDLVKSQHNLSLVTAVGYVVPLSAGATGKTLLAAQEEDFRTRFLSALPPAQRGTVARAVEDIRLRGWGQTVGEVDVGAAAVAIPVTVGGERCALSISGPAERLRALGWENLRTALTQAVGRFRQKEALL